MKKYRQRFKGKERPIVVINIALKKSRAYELRNFSMLTMRALVEFHSKSDLPRKWRLSKDEKRLYLE